MSIDIIIMDSLWCNIGHSPAELEKSGDEYTGLTPCKGAACERWHEGEWDCIRMERVRDGHRV